MARTPKTEGDAASNKPKRQAGPLTVYAVLADGVDKQMLKASIRKVTTSRTELLKLMGEDDTQTSFIAFKVERGKRNDADTVSVE